MEQGLDWHASRLGNGNGQGRPQRKNEMNEQDRPIITKLEKPLHFGDWHDKPVRWNVEWNGKNQMFSTKKDAQSYARYWFKVKDELKAVTTWTDHIGVTVPIKR